jgi:prophage regulatory protein
MGALELQVPSMTTAATVIDLPKTGYVRASGLVPGILPIGRSTLHLWVKQGRFPAPVKLGPATTAWKCEDVRAWMESRK